MATRGAPGSGSKAASTAIVASGALARAPVREPRPQRELHRAVGARVDPRQPPEAGVVRGAVPGRAHEVQPRHPVGGDRLLGAVDHQLEGGDPVPRLEARPAHEQRGAGAYADRRRERRVEPYVERWAGWQGAPSVPCAHVHRPWRGRRLRAGPGTPGVRVVAELAGDAAAPGARPRAPQGVARARARSLRARALRRLAGGPPRRAARPHRCRLRGRRVRALRAVPRLDADLWALLLTQEYDSVPEHPRAAPRRAGPVAPGAVERRQRRAARGPERRVLRAAVRALRAARRACRSPRRACSTSAAAGVASPASSRATWRPARLHGCDPVGAILDVCRDCGVPAKLAHSEFVPERLPVRRSGSTSRSPSRSSPTSRSRRTTRCLGALHAGMRARRDPGRDGAAGRVPALLRRAAPGARRARPEPERRLRGAPLPLRRRIPPSRRTRSTRAAR